MHCPSRAITWTYQQAPAAEQEGPAHNPLFNSPAPHPVPEELVQRDPSGTGRMHYLTGPEITADNDNARHLRGCFVWLRGFEPLRYGVWASPPFRIALFTIPVKP